MEEKAKKSKIVEKLPYAQAIYIGLGIIATLIGLVGVFKEKDKTEPQIVIIREENKYENREQARTVQPIIEPANQTIKEQSDPGDHTQVNIVSKNDNTVYKKQAEVVVEKKDPVKSVETAEPAFGFVKGAKVTTNSTATKTMKQVFSSAYIIGQINVQTGQAIKIRVTEELNDGEVFVMANTTLKGVLKISDGRVYAEFKDGSGNILFLCDRSELLGLTKTEILPDGFQIKISNQNK